jgi:hypothetical protein
MIAMVALRARSFGTEVPQDDAGVIDWVIDLGQTEPLALTHQRLALPRPDGYTGARFSIQ